MKNMDGLFTVLRLYLIRHGETEANVQGIVVGNAESPLTSLGIDQAKQLGRDSSWLTRLSCHHHQRNQNHPHLLLFDRICCSDLERAKHTAALTLGEMQSSLRSEATTTTTTSTAMGLLLLENVSYTAELRELAKGPRQGFPKHMSMDEAMDRRRQLSTTDDPLPLLETEDDGWDRMSRWLDRQIRAAIDATITSSSSTRDDKNMFRVLAFGHAGIFRVFLTRLIGKETLLAHPHAKIDPDGRFSVPNTSVTILDLYLDTATDDKNIGSDVKPEHRIKKIDVILLTSTEHYKVQSS